MVSKPATNNRMAVDTTSSSVSRSSLSLVSTRELSRSSRGAAPPLFEQGSEVLAERAEGRDRGVGLLAAEHRLNALGRGPYVGL